MFDRPMLSGRDFHGGDLAPDGRSVVVNEAFARRYTKGDSPVGRSVRFPGSDWAQPAPWLDIVGMVRDIGMEPTNLGEAPYVYRAAPDAHLLRDERQQQNHYHGVAGDDAAPDEDERSPEDASGRWFEC